MVEVWKDIKGYNYYSGLYQVSNLGRVRSLTKLKRYRNKIKSQRIKTTGYFVTDLKYNNIKKTAMIHRLVAYAFINNPHNKAQVNHIDGDKLNNSVDNLEWCTNLENNEHARRTGLINDYGENSCHAILSKKEVVEIRKKYATGDYMQKDLAKEYNIGYVEIHRIVRNKRWKHMERSS